MASSHSSTRTIPLATPPQSPPLPSPPPAVVVAAVSVGEAAWLESEAGVGIGVKVLVSERGLHLVEQPTNEETTEAKAVILTETAFEPRPPRRTLTSTSASWSGDESTVGLVPVALVKQQNEYALKSSPKLEHNLLIAMGFMELANASDFAANVWNTEPVPVVAIVFMAIGGTIAGIFSLLTLRDVRRAWRNVCFLRQQRRGLLEARARHLKETPGASVMHVDALLAVSYRELGTEFICRWALGIFMGFGAFLISVGTYMALGGRNRTVFFVSNLLSGYVGNTPIAVVGLVNAAWAGYIWRKARSHLRAAATVMPGTRAAALMKRRTRNVQIYCAVNGMTTVLGGIGSLITSTRWWGYVLLIPVILSAIFCNFWWRIRVGYARYDLVGVAVRSGGRVKVDELATSLELAARAEVDINESAAAPLDGLVPDATSLYQVVRFLADQNLLEAFCLRVINDAKLRAAICGSSSDCEEISLDVLALCSVAEAVHPLMISEAQDLMRETGSEHFRHNERFAAELLGSYLELLLASRHAASGDGTSGDDGGGRGDKDESKRP